MGRTPVRAPASIRSGATSAMGSEPHVYRATAEYADGSIEQSNLVVIPAISAPLLPAPTNLGYGRPEVRLHGEDTYTVTCSLQWHAGNRCASGSVSGSWCPIYGVRLDETWTLSKHTSDKVVVLEHGGLARRAPRQRRLGGRPVAERAAAISVRRSYYTSLSNMRQSRRRTADASASGWCHSCHSSRGRHHNNLDLL
jgi:hypothetical protein